MIIRTGEEARPLEAKLFFVWGGCQFKLLMARASASITGEWKDTVQFVLVAAVIGILIRGQGFIPQIGEVQVLTLIAVALGAGLLLLVRWLRRSPTLMATILFERFREDIAREHQILPDQLFRYPLKPLSAGSGTSS